jgi:CheW-like domain
MSLRGHHRVTAAVQTASFLIVRFGKSHCALPSQGIRGVLTCEEVGGEQTVIAASVTYHDVDLAGRFSATIDLTHPDTRVVLYSNGHSHGAIRVEEVIGMIDLGREECKPLPPHFRQDERHWISGTAIFQDHLVLILNPEWVVGEIGEEMSVGAGSGEGKSLPQPAVFGDPC